MQLQPKEGFVKRLSVTNTTVVGRCSFVMDRVATRHKYLGLSKHQQVYGKHGYVQTIATPNWAVEFVKDRVAIRHTCGV